MKAFGKILICSATFVSGGAVGYWLAKKKYITLAEQEVESVKKEFTEYYANHEVVKEQEKPTKKEEPQIKVTQISSIDNYKANTEDKYKNYAKPYQTEEVEQKVKATKEAQEKPNKKKCKPPYVISNDTYSTSDYESKSLYYYIKDEILTDDSGRKIDDVTSLIGKDFKNYLSTEDFVYVRNEEVEVDFEVVFETCSFASRKSSERVIDEEN